MFARHGLPRKILSDQGTRFMMQGVCKRLGIESITTTPYHPQANGVVEQFHGTLVPMLRKAVAKQLDWPMQLPFCLFAPLIDLQVTLHSSCCWGEMSVHRWT